MENPLRYSSQGALGFISMSCSFEPILDHVIECFGVEGTFKGTYPLCRCVTTRIVKNVFLISSLNLLSCNLKPLCLVLSLWALLKPPLRTKRLHQAVLQLSPSPLLQQPVFCGREAAAAAEERKMADRWFSSCNSLAGRTKELVLLLLASHEARVKKGQARGFFLSLILTSNG